VVHISSGISALAARSLVGKRRDFRTEPMAPPIAHDALQGRRFCGLAGSGSTPGSAIRFRKIDGPAPSSSAHLAAAAAALSWVLVEWLYKGKPTTLGAASAGRLADLVAITRVPRFVGTHVRSGHRFVAGALCYLGLWGRTSLGTMTVSMSSESMGLEEPGSARHRALCFENGLMSRSRWALLWDPAFWGSVWRFFPPGGTPLQSPYVVEILDGTWGLG